MTQGERLARIETLIESILANQAAMLFDLQAIKCDASKDKADLAALKNRGVGILIGVSLLATFLGTRLQAIFAGIASAFK